MLPVLSCPGIPFLGKGYPGNNGINCPAGASEPPVDVLKSHSVGIFIKSNNGATIDCNIEKQLGSEILREQFYREGLMP
jgi:hypothetical protein